jgi:hypothetical protein
VREIGAQGALIWRVPPFELRLSSGHYDRFWAAARGPRSPSRLHTLRVAVSKKVNTGRSQEIENYRRSAI